MNISQTNVPKYVRNHSLPAKIEDELEKAKMKAQQAEGPDSQRVQANGDPREQRDGRVLVRAGSGGAVWARRDSGGTAASRRSTARGVHHPPHTECSGHISRIYRL